MDFRYLVETKNEFNNFLCGILVPHIFHGIKGMYKYSENVFEQIEQKNKKGSRINNPGIIQIFKKTLDGIKELNNYEIEEEYKRIKIKSGCDDFFDNLIRATFKSFVLFLTWDPKSEESKYIDNEIYENLSIKDFIHKCYIISCDYFKENPELFLNSKSNKKDIFEIIKNCIELSLKKCLPYNQIIEEYLQIEFTKKESKYSRELADVKNLVNDMINNNKYGNKPQVNAIIKEDSEEFININNNISRKQEVENFINNEIIKENRKNESLIQTSDITSEQNIKSDEPDNLDISNESDKSKISEILEVSKTSGVNEILELSKTSDKIDDNDLILSRTPNNITSVVTRSVIKSKELDEILDNNISETSDDNVNKSESINIITSPPVIKKNTIDRLNELQQFNTNNSKKDINIKMRKKGEVTNKINGEIDSYFDSIIK